MCDTCKPAAKPADELAITAAQDEGYFVRGHSVRSNYESLLNVLFAGTLDECLAYVGKRMKREA